MATRVNTRFVILLSSLILVVVMGLAAIYVLKVQRSPEERMRRGEVYLAQGDYRLAADQFGRALARRSSDLDLIRKYESIVAQIPTRDFLEARRYHDQIHQARRMATELRPEDPELLDAYLSFLADMGAWDAVYSYANGKLQQYPNFAMARRHRGIANRHVLQPDMPQARIDEAGQDLLQSYEADPTDADVAWNFARWHLFEANRLQRTGGRASDVAQRNEFALEIAQRMHEHDPSDLDRQLYLLDILQHPQVNRTQDARPIIDQLEQRLLQQPDSVQAVLTVVDGLVRTDSQRVERAGRPAVTRGLERAQALLERAIDHSPQVLRYRVVLGRLLATQGEADAAIEQFQQVWDLGESRTPREAVRAHELRMTAAMERLRLEAGKAEAMPAGDNRRAEFARLEKQIGELEATLGGSVGMTHYLRGRIALARGEHGQAVQRLDQAARQLAGHQHEAEALFYSSRARAAVGDRGAALAPLQRIVTIMPGNLMARLELARLMTDLRQFDEAQGHLDAVLAAAPEERQALALQAQLHAAQGRVDQAVTALERAGGDRAEALVPMAQLKARAGDMDAARAMLVQRLEAEPTDLQALAMLLPMLPESDRPATLARAKQAGANEAMVRLLEMQISGGELDQEEIVQQIIAQQDDPLQRELAQVMLFRRTGQHERAEQAMQRAVALSPDNAQVIEIQFNDALIAEDWRKAEQLASRAATLNLDLANGAFFRGRMAAARNQLDEAVAEYRRGLGSREVFSEGWRQLGEVHARSGNLEAATEAYRRSIEQRPDNVGALRGLAAVMDARGDHAAALRTLRDALNHNVDAELLRLYLGYEQQHGEAERALQLRQRLAEQNPRDTDNRRNLALLLATLQRHDEAVAVTEKLVADEGLTRNNVTTLASVYGIAGEHATGRQMIADYLQSRGDQAEADDLLVLARYDLALGDFDAAMQTYRRARASEDPQTRTVTRELADLLFASGRNEEAVPLYRALHEERPDDATVALRFAEALLRTGDVAAAQRIVSQHPNSSEARVLDAVVAMQEDRLDDAQRSLERAVELRPTNTTALVQLAGLLSRTPPGVARARQLLLGALRNNPDLAEARAALGELHLRQGETADAIREFNTLLSQQPGNAAVRIRLVELYAGQRNLTAARSLLQQARQIQPDEPTWPQLAARIEASAGNFEQAVPPAKRLVELAATPETVAMLATLQVRAEQPREALQTLSGHPEMVSGEPQLQALRGWALAASGQQPESQAVFGRAIERSRSMAQVAAVASHMAQAYGFSGAIAQLEAAPTPSNPVWVQMALADLEMQNRQFEDAAQRLQAVAGQVTGGDRLSHHRMLGLALYQSKRYPEARDVYRRVLEMQPDDVATLNNLAFLLVDGLNEPGEGLELAERAVSLVPDNAQIVDTLGWAQFKAGRPGEARQTLERAMRLQPLAPSAYHLARVYQAQDALPQARQMAQRAVELAQQSGDDAVLSQARTLLAQLDG
jgi:tetratricopeptide (TPR) repeat protein